MSGGPRSAQRISTDGGVDTYRYTFPVPKYAHSPTAVWKVTQVLDAALPPGLTYGFSARSAVDSTAPTLVSVTPEVDARLKSATQHLPYRVKVGEGEAGLSYARVTATGPGGLTSSKSSAIIRVIPHPLSKIIDPEVAVAVPIPSDSVGSWTVTEVETVDILGNKSTFSGLSLAPIVVTDNSKIRAGNIAVASRDTWHEDQLSSLTTTLYYAAPITRAVLSVQAPCTVGTPVLPQATGGTLSIPISVPVKTKACAVDGLAVYDDTGNVSVYGTKYFAPALPAFNQMTGPGPELRGVSVNKTSINWRERTTVEVTLDVHSWSPGVTQALVDLRGFQKIVDVPAVREGKVVVPVEIMFERAQVEELTVWVQLIDAAGIVTFPPIPTPQPVISVVFPPEVSRFTPVAPSRALDTRGSQAGPIGAGQSRPVSIEGIPADATTVVLNVVATEATASSYLTVWADGGPRPTASNLNFVRGQTVANLVTVPVSNGRVQIYNHSGSVHVVADVFGYYRPGPGDLFGTWPLTRALDTRVSGGAFTHGTERAVSVGDVERTSPSAVVLNVTVTGSTAPGYLTVWSDGAPRPATSNINFPAGWTGANQVIVPVDSWNSRKIRIYNHGGNAHVIVDVAGFFHSDGQFTNLFVSTDPKRVMDTRVGAPLGRAGTRELAIPGLPANATAVVLNMTATEPTESSYLTVWPFGTTRPGTSNLNFAKGQTVPNMVTVPIVDGKVLIYNNAGSTHVVADLFGYYVR